jgi:hypothetical protein
MRTLLWEMLLFFSQNQQMNESRVLGRQRKHVAGSLNTSLSLSRTGADVELVLEDIGYLNNVAGKHPGQCIDALLPRHFYACGGGA